jgi:hypothetical protein
VSCFAHAGPVGHPRRSAKCDICPHGGIAGAFLRCLSTVAADLAWCGNMSMLEDGNHWRERAKDVLAIAQGVEDPAAKVELLEIAARYQRLGERADARTNAALTAPLAHRE